MGGGHILLHEHYIFVIAATEGKNSGQAQQRRLQVGRVPSFFYFVLHGKSNNLLVLCVPVL